MQYEAVSGVPVWVDPRELWPNEARDFTPWLQQHAHLLVEALGIELRVDGTEQPLHTRRVDLVGWDETNDASLVIENQLDRSDDDHCVRLFVYEAGRRAGTAIWIATSFRPEHIDLLAERNRDSGGAKRYFALQLVTCRGLFDGDQVAGFHVVVEPSDWVPTVHSTIAARGRIPIPSPRQSRSSSRASGRADVWVSAIQEAERRGWAPRSHRSALIKMKGPIPKSAFQFNWYRWFDLRSEFGVYPSSDKDQAYVQRVFEVLDSNRESIQMLYGDHEDVLFKAPGSDNNKGTGIYVARLANTEEPLEPLTSWLIESGSRLRTIVAGLGLERLVKQQ